MMILLKYGLVETSECIHVLNGHTYSVACVKQTKNRNYVSSDNKGVIKIWDMRTNKCILTLKAHIGRCRRVIELKNGVIASIGFLDGTIKIWETSYLGMGNIKCIVRLNGHSNGVNSLIQLRNGNLVSASQDNTIKIWDIETYKCVQTLTEHTKTIFDLKELKNGNIISGSGDNTIKIWERI